MYILKLKIRIYSYWENNNLFKPNKNKKKFSIVIPPPNVTGSLHMGHALNNSIQDLLVRYYRMNNYETLWQPGTDHAGIATQALVEKKLRDLKMLIKMKLEEINLLKKFGNGKNNMATLSLINLKNWVVLVIGQEMHLLWMRILSKAVIKVFVELHKKKLIYKAEKLVNWDTVLKTAISDLEVDQREVQFENILH